MVRTDSVPTPNLARAARKRRVYVLIYRGRARGCRRRAARAAPRRTRAHGSREPAERRTVARTPHVSPSPGSPIKSSSTNKPIKTKRFPRRVYRGNNSTVDPIKLCGVRLSVVRLFHATPQDRRPRWPVQTSQLGTLALRKYWSSATTSSPISVAARDWIHECCSLFWRT